MNGAAVHNAAVASGHAIEILLPEDQTASAQSGALADYLSAAAEAALNAAGADDSAITIVLASDEDSRRLNREFRGSDKPTNVLSFAASDQATQPGDPPYLGDLILAQDTIAREASEQEKTFLQHTSHLVVHGVLHLLGYTHDTNHDAACMEALEIAALARLGLPDPYGETTHAET